MDAVIGLFVTLGIIVWLISLTISGIKNEIKKGVEAKKNIRDERTESKDGGGLKHN